MPVGMQQGYFFPVIYERKKSLLLFQSAHGDSPFHAIVLHSLRRLPDEVRNHQRAACVGIFPGIAVGEAYHGVGFALHN